MTPMVERLLARWFKQADGEDLTYEKGVDPLDKAVAADKALLAKPHNTLVKLTKEKVMPLLDDPAMPPDQAEKIRQAFGDLTQTDDMLDALYLREQNSWKDVACGKTSPALLWESTIKDMKREATAFKKYMDGGMKEAHWWRVFQKAKGAVDYQQESFLRELMKSYSSELGNEWRAACRKFEDVILHEERQYEGEWDRTRFGASEKLAKAIQVIDKASQPWLATAEKIAADYCGLPRKMGIVRDELREVLGMKYKIQEKLGKSGAFRDLILKTKSHVIEDAINMIDRDPQKAREMQKVADQMEQLYVEWAMDLNKWYGGRVDLWAKMFDYSHRFTELLKAAGYKR